jgi:DNA modification methylase
VKLVKRVILASSNPGDIVLDPFAGSGTTCEAAIQSDRQFIGCDSSSSAIEVMKQRFENLSVTFYDRARE